MKKILALISLTVIVFICLSALKSGITKYKTNKEKDRFIQTASAYLEQKYNIKIAECIEYNDANIGYVSPAAGLDGGYFNNVPQSVKFRDSTGKEINCINRDGILTDDYEIDKLYKNFYTYLSEKLGVDVKYVMFDNCGYETVNIDNHDHYVDKNIYLFLQRSTKDYANTNAEIFFNDLLSYFDDGNMDIHALENDGISREQLMQNTFSFKGTTDLNGVYVYMYDKDTDLSPQNENNTDDIYYNGINGNYYYNEKYYVICNDTGTRIQENENKP